MVTKKFGPEELRNFRYLSWPVLSHDGKKAAYVLKTPQEESGLHIPQVRWVELETRREHTLPVGTQAPVFLKNGTQMTCISDQSGKNQVWIFDLATGESRQLTRLRHGVARYSLSKDETRLVFEATLWPEEVEQNLAFTEMNAEEKAAWEAELDLRPYYISELVYKMDEWYGMRKGEFSHIGILELETGQAEILPVGMEAVWPSWSHDGKSVAFYGYPYHDARGRQAELFRWDTAAKDLIQLSENAGISVDHAPVFLPGDSGIVGMAYAPLEDGSAVMLPYLFGMDGTKRCLMDEWDEGAAHGVNPMIAGRTENGGSLSYFYLSENGRWMYFLSARHGRTSICRINLKDQTPAEAVYPGRTDIQSFCWNETGGFLCVMGTAREPAELWWNEEKLTDHNAWLRAYPQGKLEEFWIKSRDGKADLQYFLLHPVEQEEGKQYPAVLDIKGGPTTMYSTAYWHEFHALSARGFAVVYGNPRGSVGFGREFCANGVCWKPEAMHDLEDMLEDAISKGFIDPKRVGVTGGSYGGYMTNKLIGRTGHFAAAVTQRSLVNPATSYGTGDMGFVSAGELPKDFKMLDYLEDRARGNPITYIDNIKIPVLILHAFKDYRCSFEQAEQLFIAMKERNPEVPCRLVMFPEENHGLTRTGKLHNQVRHLREMVDWFARYLRKEEGHDETTA